MQQALSDAAAGQALNTTAVDQIMATLAYDWQNAYPSTYPVQPVGDALVLSQEMRLKYAPFYAACPKA